MSEPIPELVLTTPAEADRIAVVRRAVGGYARVFGADEELVDDILTAVSEACTNSVLHAYGGEPGSVRVEAAHADPCLFVTIRDWGSGMSPEVESIESSSLRLGMSLMSALADEFQIRSGPVFGTEVSFIFDLDREPRVPRPRQAPEKPELGLDTTVIDADGPGGLAALKSALSMLAAQADFSLDRLADLQLLSEVLVEKGTPAPDSSLRVSINEHENGLRLTIGPLRDGAIVPSDENGGLAGLHRIVQRLTSEARSVPLEDGEHLEVLVSRV